MTRNTLDPLDISRMAATGHIEFLKPWDRYPDRMQKFSSVFTHTIFFPAGMG